MPLGHGSQQHLGVVDIIYPNIYQTPSIISVCSESHSPYYRHLDGNPTKAIIV